MEIVIMAGGKGTRISEVNSEVPKPMIPIMGKPILEYQISCLKKQGYTNITLVIGHLGNIIRQYFEDGKKFGVNIIYLEEEYALGTAGALYYLKDVVKEDFLLINGDIIFDIDIKRFYEMHKMNNGIATILTHPNSHPYDSGIIIADEYGKVLKWLHKEDERLWYKNCVNAGLHMLSPRIFEKYNTLCKLDLDRDVLEPLISNGELYIYKSPEYIKDMGTPDRLYSVREDIKNGIVEKKNLVKKQRAIFLDRDGTINEYVGFLTDINQFKLKDNVGQAIKYINESGYLAIVITNQPVIARGEVSLDGLQVIHNKMETLLGKEGAYLDDIFYCPHHPHSGYEGERKEYKTECDCRKPRPGMFYIAAQKYNIDLKESWMVGDEMRDIEAGTKAGCKVAYIGEDAVENVLCDNNLLRCVKGILNNDE